VHQHQCLNNRQIANNSDCALQVVVKRLKSFEFMLNALRLKAGFESDLFTQRTGQSMPAIQQQLNKAQALGLLELNDKHIQPSEKGFNFLNDLQIIFL
jgi:oxygen-independent coproporphyrinogen-3 oxidase